MQRICLSCGGFLAVHETVYDCKSSHIGFERSTSNLNCACQFVSTDPPQGRAEHLLYVDDEHTFGHPTAELIRRLGYRVTYEVDPKAALALFEKDPLAYDLVITDLVMPGMTGDEFAQRVLGVRNEIPVILLTGTIESKLRKQLLKTCVRTVLTKPVTIHELATEIAFNLGCETPVLRRGEAVVDIVIADDHALFRSGLRNLLEGKQRFNVVGEAASGTEAVALTSELRPDVLFLDLRLRELSGLDVLQGLGSSSVTRVILLTAGVENNEVVQAFKCGARGILLKSNATEDLFDSIDAVMSGQYWVYCRPAPDLTDALRNSEPPNAARGRFNLTPREFEVIHALVSGCTNREIAQRLSISEQTVKHHVTNIFNKTGSSSRLELALLAVDQRLLTLP